MDGHEPKCATFRALPLIDVLGVNYYSTNTVRYCADATGVASDETAPVATTPAGLDVHHNPIPAQEHVETLPPEGELTAMGWNQDPQGLTDILLELTRRYPGLELMVTENGSAWDDEVSKDDSVAGVPGPMVADDAASWSVVPGRIVHDPKRVAYLDAHILAVARAIDAGAKVTGYYAWSLLDNFEWALWLYQTLRHRTGRLWHAGTHLEGFRIALSRYRSYQRHLSLLLLLIHIDKGMRTFSWR